MATGKIEKGYQRHLRKCEKSGKIPLTHEKYVENIKRIIAKCHKKMDEEFDMKGLEECQECGGLRRISSMSDDIPEEDYECECRAEDCNKLF